MIIIIIIIIITTTTIMLAMNRSSSRFNTNKDRAMAQANSRRLLTAEAQIQFYVKVALGQYLFRVLRFLPTKRISINATSLSSRADITLILIIRGIYNSALSSGADTTLSLIITG
jgi:hypothetical protein